MPESFDLRRWTTESRKATAAGFVALALMAGYVGSRFVPRATSHATALLTQGLPGRVPMVERQFSYSGIVKRVAPAVVTVTVENGAVAKATDLAEPRAPFGRRLPPGFESPRGYWQLGLGSGVLIRPDGYVLTNYHVVADAERVRVELPDKRSFEATVVGSDPPSDLAVLKIGAGDLPTIAFGDSNAVQVGDVVLAVGNPLGIGQTVTMGVVSAKRRATGYADGRYEDFIQTDAPINQGSSGGALVSLQGELVGINSQILSLSGGNIGLGFAIPSTMAREVSEQLIRDGVVHRSKMGVTVQPMTADLAASLGLTDVRGALVSGVEPGSAAARAGLRQGDVITEFEGRPVLEANLVRIEAANARPGSTVSLTVRRLGRQQRLSVRLAERDAERQSVPRAPKVSPRRSSRHTLGMLLEPLSLQVAARMGLPQRTTGLLITGVDPAGTAAAAGLQPGDLIARVDQVEVRGLSDLDAGLANRRDRPALLLVIRDGAGLFVALKAGR